MADDLQQGQLRILDNSFYQNPAVLVFQVKRINDKQVLMKNVVSFYMEPASSYEFDEYIADMNFAVISNSKPLDEKEVLRLLFSKQWKLFSGNL